MILKTFDIVTKLNNITNMTKGALESGIGTKVEEDGSRDPTNSRYDSGYTDFMVFL